MKIAVSIILFLLCASTCLAAPAAVVSISHKQPTLKDLPLAGNPMLLVAELQQTRDVDRDVRLMLVRDSRLMDVPVLRSYLSERDKPVYEFQFLAPLAELSYQFFLSDPSGNAVSTPRFSLRRKCIASTELVNPQPDPATEQGQKLSELTTKSEGLEQEIKQYEGATQALLDLEKLLKE